MPNPTIDPPVWAPDAAYTVEQSGFAAFDINLTEVDDFEVEVVIAIPPGATVEAQKDPADWTGSGPSTTLFSGGTWINSSVMVDDWELAVSTSGANPALTVNSNVTGSSGLLRIIVTDAAGAPITLEVPSGLFSIDRVLADPAIGSPGNSDPKELSLVTLNASTDHSVVQEMPPPMTPVTPPPPAIISSWSVDLANAIALPDFMDLGATATFTAPAIYEPETLNFSLAVALDLGATGTIDPGDPVNTIDPYEVTIETRPYRLALAIDQSGSMNGSLGGGPTKWDAAVRAAHAWSDLFAAFRPQSDHSVGVLTFQSSRSTWGTPANPGEITFRNPDNGAATVGLSALSDLEGIDTWLLGSPQAYTPIGDALVKTWEGIRDASGPSDYAGAVILLTDGYENSGTISLKSPAPSGALNTFANRRDEPSLSFANQLIGSRVYTLGIGASVDEDALNSLGTSIYRQITDSTAEITGGIITMLGDIINAEEMTPNPIPGGGFSYQHGERERVVAFIVWSDMAPTDNFVLSYKEQTSSTFTFVNDSDPAMTVTRRNTHYLIRVDLRQLMNQTVVPGLDWRLEGLDTTNPSTQVLAMVDLHTKAQIDFDKQQYLIGQPIKMTCRIRAGGTPVTDAKVTVECARPGEGLGTFLANNARRYDPPKDLLDQKAPDQVLGKGHMFQSLLQVTQQDGLAIIKDPAFQLFDDGAHGDGKTDNGDYANTFADTDKEGTYTFRFLVEGTLADGSKFSRLFVKSTWVGVSVDPGLLVFNWTLAQQLDNSVISIATFRPQSANGELLGPYRDGAITMQVHGGTLAGPVIDNRDGSYSVRVEHARGVDPILVPTINGEQMIPAGPGIDPPGAPRDCCRLYHRAFRCTLDGIKRLFGR